MAGLTTEQLLELLKTPKRVSGDQGTIVNRDVDEIIRANEYLTGKQCNRWRILQASIGTTSPLPADRFRSAYPVGGQVQAEAVLGPYAYDVPNPPHGITMPASGAPVPVYIDDLGNVLPAQANAETTLHNAFVISVTDSTQVVLQLGGIVEVLGHGLQTGHYYYLSDLVAGEAVASPPQIDAPVWFVQTASRLVLQLQRPLERS